jgi:hypothetical protein
MITISLTAPSTLSDPHALGSKRAQAPPGFDNPIQPPCLGRSVAADRRGACYGEGGFGAMKTSSRREA